SPSGGLFTYSLGLGKSGGGGGSAGGSSGGKHHLVLGPDIFRADGQEDTDETGEGAGPLAAANSAPGSAPSGSQSGHGFAQDAATPNPGFSTGVRETVTPPAAAFLYGEASQRLLPAVLPNLGQPTAPVLSAAAAPAAVLAGPASGSSSALLPGPRPPVSRVESGSATLASDEEPDEVPAARPAPRIDPVDTPLDPDAEAQVGVGSWQQGYD